MWLVAIMSEKPIQPQDKYVLRMPDGLRDRIKRVAEENGRSMNAEMIARLEESLEQDDLGKISKEDVEHALAVARGAEANERLLTSLMTASERLEALTRKHLLQHAGSLRSVADMFSNFIRAARVEKGELSAPLEALGEEAIATARNLAHEAESIAHHK